MSTKRYTSYGSNKWGIVDGALSTYEDRYTEKSTGSKLVSVVGLIVVILVIIFALKWFAGAALLAGVVPSGFVRNENSNDDNPWLAGFAVLVLVGLASYFLVF